MIEPNDIQQPLNLKDFRLELEKNIGKKIWLQTKYKSNFGNYGFLFQKSLTFNNLHGKIKNVNYWHVVLETDRGIIAIRIWDIMYYHYIKTKRREND